MQVLHEEVGNLNKPVSNGYDVTVTSLGRRPLDLSSSDGGGSTSPLGRGSPCPSHHLLSLAVLAADPGALGVYTGLLYPFSV